MINLFDWDTVFGVNYATINKSISVCGASRKDFKYVDDEDNSLKIEGSWGDWKITSSSDKKLYMKCPVAHGKFIYNNSQYSLDEGYVTVEIELEAIKVKNDSKDNPIQETYNLVQKRGDFAIVTQSNFEAVTGRKARELESMFKMYFNSNDSIIDHVFAAVTVNQKAIASSLQYLKPTSFSYASVDAGESQKEGCFALLSKTDNSPTHQISRADSNLLKYMDSDINSVFAINLGLVLRNILGRNILSFGKNWSESDFKYENDQHGNPIVTNTKQIDWADLKTEEGTVTPAMGEGKFKLEIRGTRIVLSIIDAEYWIDFKFLGLSTPIIGKYQVKLSVQQEFSVTYKNDLLTTVEDATARKITANLTPSDGVKRFMIAMKVLDIVGIVLLLVPALGGIVRWVAAPVETEALVNEGIELTAVTQDATALARELELPLLVEQLEAMNAETAELIAAARLAGTGGRVWELANLLKTYQSRLLFIGGATLAARFVGYEQIKTHLDNLPSMETFMEECVKNVKWTSTEGQFKPVSAQLDNALIIAGKLI